MKPKNKLKSIPYSTFIADKVGVLRAPTLPVSICTEILLKSAAEIRELAIEALSSAPFVDALYTASPTLYKRAMKWKSKENTNQGLEFSIARYLLRMSSRPTPFGSFSSVSLVSTDSEKTCVSAPDAGCLRKVATIDYRVQANLAKSAANESQRSALRYSPNDTISVADKHIKLLAWPRGDISAPLQFVEFEITPLLTFILNESSANSGLTIPELAYHINHSFEGQFTTEEVDHYLQELVDEEILTCDSLYCPTSDDHLLSLISQLPPESESRSKAIAMRSCIKSINSRGSDSILSQMLKLDEIASKYTALGKPAVKIDTISDNTAGSLGKKDLDVIINTVSRLADFKQRSGSLSIFKERYASLFGDASTSLAEVIPFLGHLGFPDTLNAPASMSDLLNPKFLKNNNNKAKSFGKWEEHAIALMARDSSREYIDLEGVRTSLDDESPDRLATSIDSIVTWISLWEHPLDGAQLEIRSAGTQAPGRVMGRFAHAIPALKTYLSELEKDTDDCVYSQIVHVPNPQAGNILTRCSMPGPELKIRTGGSQLTSDISISDIDVFISQGKVFLWSRSRNKEVRIRMNSAHAFSKSGDHPLYQFLNEVSNQDPNCSLPSLRRCLPHAAYLPGLRLGRVLIERRTWLLQAGDITQAGDDEKRIVSRLRDTALRIGLPTFFEEHGVDLAIPYSFQNDWNAQEFWKLLKNKGSIVVTESFPLDSRPGISSNAGPTMHEIQVTLRPMQRRTMAIPITPQPGPLIKNRSWLSWNVYCRTASQNLFLRTFKEWSKEACKTLKHEMFFVRFRDDRGDHLRMRLKASDLETSNNLRRDFEDELNRLKNSHLIYSFLYVDYIPEISRYGGFRLLSRAEEIFCRDSKIIIATLGKTTTSLTEHWRTAATAADLMLSSIGLKDISSRLEFATKAAEDFQYEMRFSAQQRKLIGNIFRKSKPIFHQDGKHIADISALNELGSCAQPGDGFDWSENGFGDLTESEIYQYRWSLLHMRFNRIYPRHSRVQEAVTWELLKRSYTRLLRFSASAPLPQKFKSALSIREKEPD